jgi:predicted nucleic acid-binding protein
VYLLSDQCFADLASRDPERGVARWLAEARPGPKELYVSAVSIGMVAAEIERLAPAERGPWRRLLAEARRVFLERDCVLDVDLSVVDAWTTLRNLELAVDDGDGVRPVGEDTRLVVATAIARDLTLVTGHAPYLDTVADVTTLKFVEP